MSLYQELQDSVVIQMKVKEARREEEEMYKDIQSGYYYIPEVSTQ